MAVHRLIRVIASAVLVGAAGLGTGVTYAAQRCVSPTGAGGCSTSIQAAVNQAQSGDTILIKAGTYVEQVTIIGKDLTLAGQRGAVVQAPLNMAQTLLPGQGEPADGEELRGVIAVKNATVTVRALTIDGANSADDNPGLVGLLYVNAGGEIRKNVVQNTGFGETLSPEFEGDGIDVFDTAFPARTITVAENRITNFNSNGMTFIGNADPSDPTAASLIAYVTKNRVTGSGPTDVIAQYGIQYGGFGEGRRIVGTVKENRVDDVFFTAEGFPALGIAIAQGLDVAVEKNVVRNVQRGIDLYLAVQTHVAKNNIRGPAPGAPGYQGIGVSGEDNEVVENTLTNLEVGIRLYNNADDGTAVNTQIRKNRFQNVTEEVAVEAGASAAVAGRAAGAAPARARR